MVLLAAPDGDDRPDTRTFKSLPAPQSAGGGSKDGDFKTRWPSVYQAIIDHQRDAEGWAYRDDVQWLRSWGHLFIKAFDLRVKDAEFMSVPLIRIERMNVKTTGTFHPKADGYAITSTIAINQERLPNLEPYQKLVLLLKYLLCAWQHRMGGNGSFSRECRDRMKAMGLTITERGEVTIDEDGPFRQLLGYFGVAVPLASEFPQPERKGRSTNLLWSCTCQKCRVGTKVFSAVCPQCNEPFRLGDHVGKRFVKMSGSTELDRLSP
jgi:hypothetical protein